MTVVQPVSTLTLDVQPGERLVLDGAATVEFVQKSGRVTRLRVTAARDVRIKREANQLGEVVPSMPQSSPG